MYYIPLRQPMDPAFMDGLLEMGWYRMSQHVFTTRHIVVSDTDIFEVLWARVVLKDWQPGSTYHKLKKQSKAFSFSIHSATISPEIESLFGQYKTSIDFEASESVASYLLEQQPYNFFPTRMWQVHHRGELIAASYFDEGVNSSAGILTFFHPDFKKYSLGLLLYLESIQLAAESGKSFFYPGYIAIDHTKFDYKLKAGLRFVEVWEAETMKWIPYAESRHATQQSI